MQASAVPAPPERGQASPLRIPILVGAIIIGLAAIVLARHYKRPDPPTETPAPGMKVGSDSVTLTNDAPMWGVVKLAPAQPSEPHWTDPVPARIVFDEARTSRLGSPLAGRVTSVMVERGQHVKTGEKLFTVSSPNLAELRADMEKAQVEANTAKINYDRTKALVDAGSLPAKELVTAQQSVTEAELAVKLSSQKMSSLKVAGAGDASFTMTAPRDGVIVEKTVNVGQNVDSSSGSVMAIADLSDVWVVADLFENDVGQLAPGTKAKVVVGTSELDGQVDQVSAVVDPDRHTVPVRVRLANIDGSLRPNAYAQIKFFDPNTAKVALPASAVMSDGVTTYVYVKEKDGQLKRRVVTAGSASAGKMPILTGIEPGDQVVVQGAILLDNQIQLDN
ncbi:MAG TPA: efflux RND transporter periplasmic adaptor subunit [Kofleriaceae bacterium]